MGCIEILLSGSPAALFNAHVPCASFSPRASGRISMRYLGNYFGNSARARAHDARILVYESQAHGKKLSHGLLSSVLRWCQELKRHITLLSDVSQIKRRSTLLSKSAGFCCLVFSDGAKRCSDTGEQNCSNGRAHARKPSLTHAALYMQSTRAAGVVPG